MPASSCINFIHRLGVAETPADVLRLETQARVDGGAGREAAERTGEVERAIEAALGRARLGDRHHQGVRRTNSPA